MTRIADIAAGLPWAIYEPALETIIEIAGRETPDAETLADWKGKMQAVATRQGKPFREGSSVTMRDGVAIVPVAGPIFRYANLFTEFSGATSIQKLAQDFQAVVDSPSVRAILLDCDTPGGEANGVAQFAAQVYAARGSKPITAYVGGLCASAGYWIAAAADKVVLDRTASVGSIGVVATMTDTRERDAKNGVQRREIVSSQSPDKRIDPATPDGKAKIQAYVDRLAQEFIGDVAKYRGATEATVMKDFGQGGLKIGSDAVAAGMADGVTTFEHVLTELAAAGAGGFKSNRAAAAATQTPKGQIMDNLTAEAVARDHASIANHFRDEGVRAATAEAEKARKEAVSVAVAAERSRILGIEALAGSFPGHDKLLADCKANGECSVERAALQLAEAEKGKRQATLDNMKSDLNAATAPTDAKSDPVGKEAKADAATVAEKIRDLRAEAAKKGKALSLAQAAHRLGFSSR